MPPAPAEPDGADPRGAIGDPPVGRTPGECAAAQDPAASHAEAWQAPGAPDLPAPLDPPRAPAPGTRPETPEG
ncbi:hypothetical protein [Streptomyces flavofungini]|uniref:Uncharacterized protein n=1 Tax=Streptomyces flavofungini TaxID=68200 RepID=A0ABS0XGG9_9ACTN|nr:hypothetical protein [Streptomyces flavofungini]MBJ3810345.1 hypothetical protein [Streptomyces flavofungini]MBJ3811969.1 hypothetical protein [Streptomyces flavofungini]